MRKTLLSFLVASLLLAACQSSAPAQDGKKTIVVTYSILGAVVEELVGERVNVIVPMPDGQDPHEWEPSARDIETLTKADLIVQNGLGLEGGMEKALGQARDAGVPFFTASDHISVRHVGEGEGIPTGDADQTEGAEDPHLWTDPLSMASIAAALAEQIKTNLGIDVSDRAQDLQSRLESLNTEIANSVNALPAENRKLVTGHESMGYFAQRYGFELIGAIIPGVSTQSEVSASELSALKTLIAENQVRAIFIELGAPQAVTEAIGQETGIKVVELTTHNLPADGSYFTFMRNLAGVIVDGLR